MLKFGSICVVASFLSISLRVSMRVGRKSMPVIACETFVDEGQQLPFRLVQ